jgi:hypothetical protein
MLQGWPDMSMLSKPTLLNLPAEIRREILIQYLLLSASGFEAPKRIHAVPFDRPLLVFCDSKAEIGSIPQLFGEIPETKPPTVGEWSNFYLPKVSLNLMLVNKLFYNEISSCILSEFALIPPRQIFRFVHWIPSLPNPNAQTFDLVRHLQLRVSFSLNEKWGESGFHDALNKEDVARFQEFRDWFGGLRSMRLQIGFFRGGKVEMEELAKKNVSRRIMRCVDVFRGVEVLLFVEKGERKEGEALAYGGDEMREKIIGDIVEECERQMGSNESRI